MEAVEGLRYRANDALRQVSKSSIREARKKEITREILNSETLKVATVPSPAPAKYIYFVCDPSCFCRHISKTIQKIYRLAILLLALNCMVLTCAL